MTLRFEYAIFNFEYHRRFPFLSIIKSITSHNPIDGFVRVGDTGICSPYGDIWAPFRPKMEDTTTRLLASRVEDEAFRPGNQAG